MHPSKKEPRVLPECVSNDDLARFHAEGRTAGPKVGDPKQPLRLNWTASLRNDPWNVASINLLAHRLHKIYAEREDRDKYSDFETDAESFRKQIITRLTPVKTAICKPIEKREGDKSITLKRMRRTARRKNVSLPSLHVSRVDL